jgi:hypothetical protein
LLPLFIDAAIDADNSRSCHAAYAIHTAAAAVAVEIKSRPLRERPRNRPISTKRSSLLFFGFMLMEAIWDHLTVKTTPIGFIDYRISCEKSSLTMIH